MNNSRIARDKQVVKQMIELYCRGRHRDRVLCDVCRDLLVYAHHRLDVCGYAEAKCECKSCPTHCYAPLYRAKICTVMRYSGPRMLLYHPVLALRYLMGV